MKKLFIVSMVLLVCFSVSFGQESQEKKVEDPPAVEKPEQVQAWQLPAHMQEALVTLLNNKVKEFKAFLVANVKGFETMPDNVIFDFTSGIFITPEELAKLQEQQKTPPVIK